MEMNILMVLALLNEAGVRVNLLNEYNPANVSTKAGENLQKVRFEQTVPYYKIPKYEISSAANLNLSFRLTGKAHDIENDRYFDAIQFKCISIVKNNVLFKNSLDICPEDVEKVTELGIDVVDNKIDLTKFSLATGIDNCSDDDLAKAIIGDYIHYVLHERKPRTSAPTMTADEQWLCANGYKDGVWWPTVTSSYERVKNHHDDRIKWKVEYRASAPTINGMLNKEAEGKKLTELEAKLMHVYEQLNGEEPEDYAPQLNTIKYSWYINNLCHSFVKDVEWMGETFHVEVTI